MKKIVFLFIILLFSPLVFADDGTGGDSNTESNSDGLIECVNVPAQKASTGPDEPIISKNLPTMRRGNRDGKECTAVATAASQLYYERCGVVYPLLVNVPESDKLRILRDAFRLRMLSVSLEVTAYGTLFGVILGLREFLHEQELDTCFKIDTQICESVVTYSDKDGRERFIFPPGTPTSDLPHYNTKGKPVAVGVMSKEMVDLATENGGSFLFRSCPSWKNISKTLEQDGDAIIITHVFNDSGGFVAGHASAVSGLGERQVIINNNGVNTRFDKTENDSFAGYEYGKLKYLQKITGLISIIPTPDTCHLDIKCPPRKMDWGTTQSESDLIDVGESNSDTLAVPEFSFFGISVFLILSLLSLFVLKKRRWR